MPLLNYTTTVPAQRTISVIADLLAKAGALAVLTEFNEAQVPTGIAFRIKTNNGVRSFMLPIESARVEAVLRKERVEPRYQTPEQAERVAWRILKDWLEAQLAIIRTEMVTLDQVMLPYMQADDGRTFYELYRDQALALPRGTDGDR